MNDPAEGRKDRRYSISEYLEDEFRDVYIEIMTDPPVRAAITDISMNGLGFIIPESETAGSKKVEQADKLFVNIHLGGDVILLNAKKTWGIVVKERSDVHNGFAERQADTSQIPGKYQKNGVTPCLERLPVIEKMKIII
jgi:hypothetical protein